MSVLTDRIALYEANNANATLSVSGMPLGQDEHGKCFICLDSKLPAELVVLNCLHGYCRDCTNDKFEVASNDPLSFPPCCCGEAIALNLFQPFLRPEVVDHFKRKEVEYNTKNPIYCHISKCHKLIPSDNIEADRATCLSCGEMTCTICKSGVHDGDCPDDPALGPLMATATKEGWKVCPSCHRLIDRIAGCNHMTYVSYLYYISPRNNFWFSDVYAVSNSVTFAELFGSNAPVHDSWDRTISWPIYVFIFQLQQPKNFQNVVFRDIFALESQRLFEEAGMEIRTARA